MKIKTFMFNTRDVNPYIDGNYACSNYKSSTIYTKKIDNIINKFCEGKEVIDIRQSSHCQGNNPPTYFIDVVVIYKEKTNEL